jgi:proteasome lid subunit RPN8/RPN11
MLKIPADIVDAIYQQAKEEAPLEACGLLTGENDQVSKRYAMRNSDQSPEHFTLDPKEHFAVLKAARNEGQKILAVYHSHPETPARPSEEDIRLAVDPHIIYVIASLHEGETIKAFRIVKDEVTTLPLEIV